MATGKSTPVHKEQATGDRILAAAATLFAERGYAATTTRELAEMANLERASLYYHTKSKEELLYKVCLSTLHDAQLVIDNAKREADPGARLRTLIVQHTTTILRNRAQNMTMLLEMRALTGPRRTEVLRIRDSYDEQVREILAQAQEEGFLRTDKSPKMLEIAMLNLLNWTLVWYDPKDELSAEELGNSFADIFLDGAVSRPAFNT